MRNKIGGMALVIKGPSQFLGTPVTCIGLFSGIAKHYPSHIPNSVQNQWKTDPVLGKEYNSSGFVWPDEYLLPIDPPPELETQPKEECLQN